MLPDSFFFASPGLITVLAPLFLLWLLLWFLIARATQSPVLRYSSLGRLADARPGWRVWARRAVSLLRVLVVALLMLAMLRPQTGKTLTEVNTVGIDIMLVLDTSGSMEARDLDSDRDISKRRNRLQVAKEVVTRFAAGRENDQIGLVVFGAQAFTQLPLTLDHDVLATFLERVEIGVAGDATALGSAVGTAVKRLRDSEAESKVIVLLTDGVNNAGSLAPSTAAEVAATEGVRIYAIGAGVRGDAPFLVQTGRGPQVFHQPNMIDEDTLQLMADRTGGRYFRAEDAEALQLIYEEIDELERTEISMQRFLETTERYRFAVFPALLLLLLETVLLNSRLRRLP